jgi:hypothetical protein
VEQSVLDGRKIVENEPRSGRTCTSKTEENGTKVKALIRPDQHLTVTMTGSELSLNHKIVHDVLTEELDMRTLVCCITTALPVTLPSQ